jgi:hypothetical protein
MAFVCITPLAQPCPYSALLGSPNWGHTMHLWVNKTTPSMFSSILNPSFSQSNPLSLPDLSFQLHLQTHTIMVLGSRNELTQSYSPNVFVNPLDHHLQVHMYVYSVMALSSTTPVSISNARVFRSALTALTEPRTLWTRNTHFLGHRWWVTFHRYLLHFAPGRWWRLSTIRMTPVIHSSQGVAVML